MYSVRQAAKRPTEVEPSSRSGTPLLNQWVSACTVLTHQDASFYSGCRKIIREVKIPFDLAGELSLRDSGYTSNKMKMLERNYVHPESIRVARELWKKRCSQEKYGSVGFTTYAHFKKGDVGGKTPRGSVFGPCIQSVILTWADKRTNHIDIFYRTTEIYKKFPADLVFIRDVLLDQFKLQQMTATFHFANVTVHPMYWVTVAPHLNDPIKAIQSIQDAYFRNWIIKWTARYVCGEYSRGIQKFSQALRVRKDALERIDKKKLKALQEYLRANHPGYRGDDNGDEDE